MSTPPIEPLVLRKWIDEHRDEFVPPVSNKVIWHDSEFIAMVVHGPNARSDFHIDPGDEIFYQLEGAIRVDLLVADEVRQHRVEAGGLLLVPAGVPHAPRRPADSWGLVIERQRRPGELDELLWRCSSCGTDLHRVVFALADIETELRTAIEEFAASIELRTCDQCATVAPVPESFSWDD